MRSTSVIRAYQSGQTMQAVAERHGTNYNAVRAILMGAEVKLRPKGPGLTRYPAKGHLGKALRKHRLKRKMSQTQLAFKAHSTTAAISSIERGHREPSLATLKKLAAALGTRVGALLKE